MQQSKPIWQMAKSKEKITTTREINDKSPQKLPETKDFVPKATLVLTASRKVK
ncbi:MAG: hypothetical protein HC847_09695 [Hydrococcus sp. RU_2_2]|nr:hypothetical protein [Hydrococcus sp. RU_2_2]